MLSFIFRFLTTIFGRQVFERKNVSSVTKSIDYLPVSKKAKWIWGGVAHAIPIVVVLVLLYYFADSGTHGLTEWTALILGATWGSVGPVFIWIFERLTLPALWYACKNRLTIPTERRYVRATIYSNTFSHNGFRVVTVAWVAFVLYYFWSARQFFSGYGVLSYGGLWWLFAIGTLFFAYYSALGICFALRSILIVRKISQCTLKPDIYSPDNAFGLSFLGTFALRMNMMFLTGWLLIPLVVLLAADHPEQSTTNSMTLVYGYAAIILAATLLPIVLVHRKLNSIKDKLLGEWVKRTSRYLSLVQENPSERTAVTFLSSRALVNDVSRTGTWPLNVDKLVVFVLTNMLPIALGALAAWLGWSD